jgi:hypothetical protein
MTGAVWYAILVYILGMAVVLYLRPAFMFKPSGVWKEFGVGATEGYTVFPFWMFSIVWAVVSYAAVTVSKVMISSIVQKSEQVPAQTYAPVATPISQMQPPITNTVTSISKRPPGYYILENLPDGPRYVYWGTEPPSMSNVTVRQSL